MNLSDFKFRALTSLDWRKVKDPALVGGDELKLVDKEDIREGIYASAPLDSGISGCVWHRIVIDARIPENSFITIYHLASDDPGDLEDKPGFMAPSDSEVVTFRQVNDSLLREQQGRFIRLWIRIRKAGKETPVLKQVKIYYPRLTYLRYLPAVYQEDSQSRDFLERFLSIFESRLYDSDEVITRLPAYFDPKAAPNQPENDFVKWLASWLSLDLYDLLGENNRDFVLNAVNLYKMKGTAEGLSRLACTITGKGRCCVKEYKNNVFRTYGLESIEDEKARSYKRCTRFYRNISRTFDPGKVEISNNGKYEDETHYVFGNPGKGTIKYSPYVVGLFIFSPPGEPFKDDTKELTKILRSFLPAFVDIKIYLEDETPFEEIFDKPALMEYGDRVTGSYIEMPKVAEDVYHDKAANWAWMYTYQKGPHEFERTAKSSERPKFRTWHDGIKIDK